MNRQNVENLCRKLKAGETDVHDEKKGAGDPQSSLPLSKIEEISRWQACNDGWTSWTMLGSVQNSSLWDSDWKTGLSKTVCTMGAKNIEWRAWGKSSGSAQSFLARNEKKVTTFWTTSWQETKRRCFTIHLRPSGVSALATHPSNVNEKTHSNCLLGQEEASSSRFPASRGHHKC